MRRGGGQDLGKWAHHAEAETIPDAAIVYAASAGVRHLLRFPFAARASLRRRKARMQGCHAGGSG